MRPVQAYELPGLGIPACPPLDGTIDTDHDDCGAETDIETYSDNEKTDKMADRTFKDSVHGWITFNSRVCTIIDTPHFQRLRNVKQLGTSYYVWPAASHNRFEHCLGVAHLAQEQIRFIKERQPDLYITEEDIDCVTIAGLCHDLGHGPWSHVWDSLFIPKALPNKQWKHEDASEMMFDHLIKLPHVHIRPEEAIIIKALIAGDPTRCSGMNVKPFLFDIVANKRNGLDVDKFDYIARDNHAIGQGENVSLGKLIRSARVIKNEICYDIKDANSVYELCWSRFSLHKRIYNHKTAKAIEYMIIDALLSAQKHMRIADHIDNPEDFLYLTDDIKTRIEMTKTPELQDAREIFNRINTRQLYKEVDSNVFVWDQKERCRDYFTPERIVKAAKLKCEASRYAADVEELTAAHVIVDLAEMHYGMKDRNPLDTVKFYSKRRPDVALKAEPGFISHIMPERFGEVLLRVYSRDRRPSFPYVIQKGYRELLQEFKKQEDSLSRVLASPGLEPTEGPSTPGPSERRSLSRVSSAKLFTEGSGSLNMTPSGNPFTKFTKRSSLEHFVGAGDRSPSPTPDTVKSSKRARHEGSESPPRKRSKSGK